MSGDWKLLEFNPQTVLALVLLVLLPLVWWRWSRRRRYAAVQFSTVSGAVRLPRTLAVRARFLPPLLRTLALALLIVCIAGPRKGDEETEIHAEGIAIQMLLDRSSSMLAEDFSLNGRRVTRLDAVEHVAHDFVMGATDDDAGLTGRPNDLVGLITFAGFADSLCPLTLDHDYLAEMLEEVRAADAARWGKQEDGTAIGDALGLAVERMRDLEARRKESGQAPIESKVVVLLTDGEQTAGDLTPQQGAEIAQAFGIRVYTIGVGSDGVVMVRTAGGGRMPARVSFDEDTLKEIAETTGGAYFRAKDTQSLRRVYAKINELEKTKVEQKRFLQYAELATTPVHLGSLTVPPLLLVVLGLLALEWLLSNTRLQSLP